MHSLHVIIQQCRNINLTALGDPGGLFPICAAILIVKNGSKLAFSQQPNKEGIKLHLRLWNSFLYYSYQ